MYDNDCRTNEQYNKVCHMNVNDLIKRVQDKELLLMIYSDRDIVRVNQLRVEIESLNATIMNMMTDINTNWLTEQMLRNEG